MSLDSPRVHSGRVQPRSAGFLHDLRTVSLRGLPNVVLARRAPMACSR